MEKIRRYFEQLVPLTEEEWLIFSAKLIRQEFPKRHLLTTAGEVEHYLSFIEEGAVRYYLPTDDDGRTFTFAFEHSFVSAYDSFLLQQPAVYHIETLTPTTVWRISYPDLQDIYKHTQVGNTIGRMAAEELFLKKTKRELSLLNDTAEQRYLKLFDEYPRFIQQLPLKYIAAYIGITPQALSRIRKRIS